MGDQEGAESLPGLPAAPREGPPTGPASASLELRVAELEREMRTVRAELAAQLLAAPPDPRLPLPAPTSEEPKRHAPLPQLFQHFADGAHPSISADTLSGPNHPAGPARPGRSLEDRLGSQVFNRVGIIALLIAASWGLKLAIENRWIGHAGQVATGLAAGGGLVLWSERFRSKGFAAFSYSLKAVGSGVLYLSLWAAFQLYHLLPAPAALGLMIAVAAWNAYMSWSQDSELLGAYAISGAFATPALLSTGGNHEIFLFTYIGAIDLCTLGLVRLKPWPRLLLLTLVGTLLFYSSWYGSFYSYGFRPAVTPPFALTAGFVAVFFLLFAAPGVRGVLRWADPAAVGDALPAARVPIGRSPAILAVLLPFLNAGFAALALALLFRQHFHADTLPWLMAGFALVYLLLARVQRTEASAAMHLALAVVFLTVAIPLKASGHTLTVAWFAEGIALLWVSTRLPLATPEGQGGRLTPSKVLRTLSLAGFVLGSTALIFDRFLSELFDAQTFLNADLFASLFAAACFGAAATLLLLRPRAGAAVLSDEPGAALLALSCVDGTAVLLAVRELGHVGSGGTHPAFFNPDFGSAVVGLLLLLCSMRACLWFSASSARRALRGLAGATFVLFNLVFILSVEAEINRWWRASDANVERSLAISAFLMLYGAALLTLGFLRRSTFTRWQALLLILFTILKVFLYDMSSLSQGYRVVSFLGLGVLLLAVSFAYQKDWLGLKAAHDPAAEAPTDPAAVPSAVPKGGQ